MKVFFLESCPWDLDTYVISNNFDKLDMPMINTSYQLLQARLVGMTYKEYLDFCKYSLGAEVIKRPNQRWAFVHFKDTADVNRFIEVLNHNFNKGL